MRRCGQVWPSPHICSHDTTPRVTTWPPSVGSCLAREGAEGPRVWQSIDQPSVGALPNRSRTICFLRLAVYWNRCPPILLQGLQHSRCVRWIGSFLHDLEEFLTGWSEQNPFNFDRLHRLALYLWPNSVTKLTPVVEPGFLGETDLWQSPCTKSCR